MPETLKSEEQNNASAARAKTKLERLFGGGAEGGWDR